MDRYVVLGFVLRVRMGGDLAELCLVIHDRLLKDLREVLRMLRADRYDGLRTRLVRSRDLVKEDERELVVLICHLDPVRVDRIEIRREIDCNFALFHRYY